MKFFGAITDSGSAHWQSEPQHRGSWNIISTCLITTGFCVWTAVHLNLPAHGVASKQKWRKARWLILGLFAPEMVAYTAWRQWREASELGAYINEKKGEGAAKRLVWTKTHSFYAIMGGFAFDTATLEENLLSAGRKRVTLTPRALKFILNHHAELLPNISESKIRDKSKSDGFAMMWVCIQASWFCIQCVYRLASGLAITLLELNTFGHSICTLLIYLLWWNKLVDISEPHLIRGERTIPLCALMCLASPWGNSKAETDYFQSTPRPKESANTFLERRLGIYQKKSEAHYDPDLLRIRYHPVRSKWPAGVCSNYAGMLQDPEKLVSQGVNAPASNQQRFRQSEGLRKRRRFVPSPPYMNQSIPEDPNNRFGTIKVCLGQTLFGFCFEKIPQEISSLEKKSSNYSPAILHLDPADVLRWKYAAEALTKYDLLEDQFGQTFVKGLYIRNGQYQDREDCFYGSVQDRSLNWPSEMNLDRIRQARHISLAYAGFTLAGATYGGLHLLAWNAPFASQAQALLWRTSGLTLVCSGPACAIFWVMQSWFRVGISEWEKDPFKSSRRVFLRALVYGFQIWVTAGWIFSTLALVGFALCYACARVYLIVECFISLAFPPDDVFELPSWTAYFPHFS